MSSRTVKIVTVIAVVAIVFSAFNTYLILDSTRIQEQLTSQEKKIDDIQASLEQLSIQNQQPALETGLPKRQARLLPAALGQELIDLQLQTLNVLPGSEIEGLHHLMHLVGDQFLQFRHHSV